MTKKQLKQIKERQVFLDVYNDFDDWLNGLGFRMGHYWKESGGALDCNYWKDIESLRSVEHYVNDTLQLSIRFIRLREEHSFHIICGYMLLSRKLSMTEMKDHIFSICQEIKKKKLDKLESLKC
jgi:hypothetical protein